jgi:hypothetical protein
MANADQWLSQLTKLRVDRSKGLAPHKPLLLALTGWWWSTVSSPPVSVSLTPQ